MITKRARVLLSLAAASFWLYFLVAGIGYQKVAVAAEDKAACETEIPGPDEDIVTVNGYRIKVIDTDLYVCAFGKWIFSKSMITRFGKKYAIRKTGEECEVTFLESGKKYSLTRHFSSGFEEPVFRSLFTTGGWNATALQSPKASSPKEYVDLHQNLMQGGKFLDNRMDLDSKNAHSGKQALRFYAVNPQKSTKKGRKVSKALIQKKDLCFGKGDHLWFSAWYYLEKGTPSTLFDFENMRFQGAPGMRLFVQRQKYATLELKFADKPLYSQLEVPLPRQKWFNLKMHLVLSNNDDGIIELWQDGVKILSARGKTLPTHDAIYNSLEIGITASPREATLLVDDVIVSNEKF